MDGIFSPALTNLNSHSSGDNVTGSKIFGSRGISLHKPLTLIVDKVTSFTTTTFGDEAPCTVDTCKQFPGLNIHLRNTLNLGRRIERRSWPCGLELVKDFEANNKTVSIIWSNLMANID